MSGRSENSPSIPITNGLSRGANRILQAHPLVLNPFQPRVLKSDATQMAAEKRTSEKTMSRLLIGIVLRRARYNALSLMWRIG